MKRQRYRLGVTARVAATLIVVLGATIGILYFVERPAIDVDGSVDGVASARNDLRAVASQRPRGAIPKSDETLVVDVREALASSGAIGLGAVVIEVRSGLVELSGAVRCEAEKQLAEMLAGSTDGVVGVVNELNIS